MPAPWVQLKLLQILAVLGASDKNASEGMYEILREVMKRSDNIGINVGYAIVYECVRTVTSIYPDPSLIEDAANSISRFITSDNHNLKYLGVNALASIVQIDSKYAAEHQLVVIDCLEDPDETLKRKTLDLLYSMTNPQNVTVIVQKLTQYLQTSTDQYLRQELVSRINQLAEKYAPSNEWFIATMNNVFELSGSTSTSVGSTPNMQASYGTQSNGGSGASKVGASEKLIKNEMSQSILRLIAENANQLLINFPDGKVPSEEEDIRRYAADTYIALLSSKRKSYTATIPDILIQVIAWVLGEYGNLSSTTSPVDVLNLLVTLMERQVDSPALTKSWILGAILKMGSKVLSTGQSIPNNVVQLVTKYQNSLFVDLQQRSFEFLELLKSPQTFQRVVPPENTFNLEIQIDENLSFLDGYVEMALKNGAKAYNNDPIAKAKLAAEAASEHSLYGAASGGGGGLKFQAYAAPEREVATAPVVTATPHLAGALASTYGGGFEATTNHASIGAAAAVAEPAESGLRFGSGAPRRWGPSGYNDPDVPSASSSSAAAAATPASVGPTIVAMPSAQQQAQTAAAIAFSRQQEADREAAAARDREKERKAKELASRPRELTEREKMAANLFAGVGGTAAAPAKPRVTPVARAPVQPVQAQVVQQPASASADFLGGLIDATPVAAAPKPAPAAADPLDLLFGGSIAPTPVQQTQPQASSSGDLFDMLGGGAPAAAPQSQQQQPIGLFDSLSISTPVNSNPNGFNSSPSVGGSLLDDPFGFSSPAVSSPPSSLGGDLFGLGDGATKYGAAGSHLTAQLASLKKSPMGEVTLINDARLQLTTYRGFTDQATIVVLFLSNKSPAPITNVNLAFNLPNGMAASITGDGGASVATNGNQQVISFGQVPARSTVTQLVSLGVRELSAFAPTSGPFQLSAGSVSFAGAPAPFSFAVDLAISDFLRPASMKTDAYGQSWKSLSEEVKTVARPTTCNTPAEFMSRMEKSMNAFPVQTIGQENICAARIVAASGIALPPNQLLVLVHGKVHSHIDLIVRSKAKELSTAVGKQLAIVLK